MNTFFKGLISFFGGTYKMTEKEVKEKYPDAHKHAERLRNRMVGVCKPKIIKSVVFESFFFKNGKLVRYQCGLVHRDSHIRYMKLMQKFHPFSSLIMFLLDEEKLVTATLHWDQGVDVVPILLFDSDVFIKSKEDEIRALLQPTELNDSIMPEYM